MNGSRGVHLVSQKIAACLFSQVVRLKTNSSGGPGKQCNESRFDQSLEIDRYVRARRRSVPGHATVRSGVDQAPPQLSQARLSLLYRLALKEPVPPTAWIYLDQFIDNRGIFENRARPRVHDPGYPSARVPASDRRHGGQRVDHVTNRA